MKSPRLLIESGGFFNGSFYPTGRVSVGATVGGILPEFERLGRLTINLLSVKKKREKYHKGKQILLLFSLAVKN